VHRELHAPDTACGWVGAGLDCPGWELLGESADVGPFAGACEGGGFGGGGAAVKLQ
jgi:hypothetical protein